MNKSKLATLAYAAIACWYCHMSRSQKLDSYAAFTVAMSHDKNANDVRCTLLAADIIVSIYSLNA